MEGRAGFVAGNTGFSGNSRRTPRPKLHPPLGGRGAFRRETRLEFTLSLIPFYFMLHNNTRKWLLYKDLESDEEPLKLSVSWHLVPELWQNNPSYRYTYVCVYSQAVYVLVVPSPTESALKTRDRNFLLLKFITVPASRTRRREWTAWKNTRFITNAPK